MWQDPEDGHGVAESLALFVPFPNVTALDKYLKLLSPANFCYCLFA